MSNLIWISSYPKSGNTMLRLFLGLYFFSKNGKLVNFDILKNIVSFNHYDIFNNVPNIPELNEFIKDPELVGKYWLEAQEYLLKSHKNKIFFLKTHNALVKYNSVNFTNKKFIKSIFYLVRDPRSVLISAAYHYGRKTLEESKEFLISDKAITYVQDKLLPEFILSWKTNYVSWKNFLDEEPDLGMIIKYEDLVQDPEKYFYKILKFLSHKLNQNIDNKKFLNVLESIKFKNLKSMEDKISFPEKSKKNKKFFRKGKVDEWKDIIPLNILKDIEEDFYDQMKELKYL